MKRIVQIIVVLILAFMAGHQTVAQTSQKNQKARLEREIEIINSQLKDNATKSSSALSKLNLVRKNISNRKELVKESDREISAIDADIRAKQGEIDLLQRRVDTLSAYYEKLVKNAYKNRDARVWYMYILASDNIPRAFRRTGYLRSLSSQMNNQGRKIIEARSELEAQRQELQVLRADAQKVRAERQAEVQKLKNEEAASEKLVKTLQRDKSKYQKELNAKKKQVEALNREIERLIKNSGKSSAKVDYVLDKEFAKNKGKLPWPADGPVIDKYGQHVHPVYKVKMPFNRGITIAVSKGTVAKAVFDGVVSQVAVIPGYNQCVLVQHGNYFSFYCKLSGTNVKAGDKVKTGQALGTVGTFGGETQLHFEIWQGSSSQNPEIWLR